MKKMLITLGLLSLFSLKAMNRDIDDAAPSVGDIVAPVLIPSLTSPILDMRNVGSALDSDEPDSPSRVDSSEYSSDDSRSSDDEEGFYSGMSSDEEKGWNDWMEYRLNHQD